MIRTIFTIVFALFSFVSFAQSTKDSPLQINSPYSRYGLGLFNDNGFGYNTSIGRTGIGVRSNKYINNLNPASYSAQDTLSFIFDFGLTGGFTQLKSLGDKFTVKSLNFNNIVLGFHITKWWGTSIGLLPYSKVGYNIHQQTLFPNPPAEDSVNIVQVVHKGNGGLNQFYIGNSFQLTKFLSIGANFNYLFGYIDRLKTVNLYPASQNVDPGLSSELVYTERTEIGDIYYSFGIQLYRTFFQNHRVILGGTYEHETKFNSHNMESIVNYRYDNTIIEIFSDSETKEGGIKIPSKIGIGFSYDYKNFFGIAFDYKQQNWSKASFFTKKDSLADYSSLNFGMHYTPVPLEELKRAAYWQRINFRLGGHYTKLPIEINGNQLIDYGFSVGFGLPWKNYRKLFTKTTLNLTYEFGKRGIFKEDYLKETYHIITIGLSFYDNWFVKPKYD